MPSPPTPPLPTGAPTVYADVVPAEPESEPEPEPVLPRRGRPAAGRRKIPIEYIGDKGRRCICFSKRKGGLMKKAYELATLTGAEVLLLVASETGHVFTFATKRFEPMINNETGKVVIRNCLLGEPPEAALRASAHVTSPAYQNAARAALATVASSAASDLVSSHTDGTTLNLSADQPASETSTVSAADLAFFKSTSNVLPHS